MAHDRPPKTAEPELVRRLHDEQGLSLAEIGRRLRMSKAAVGFLYNGRPIKTLRPGERRVKTPVRCEAGHRCTILPCRSCRAMRNRTRRNRRIAAELKAEKLGIPVGAAPVMAVSTHLANGRPRKDPLRPRLTRKQLARLEAIKRTKMARGES